MRSQQKVHEECFSLTHMDNDKQMYFSKMLAQVQFITFANIYKESSH